MKSHTEYLTFNVPKRMDFVNITPQVKAAVTKSGIREGLVLINAMHITASVFINDDEPGLHEDYKRGWRSWPPLILRRKPTTTTAPAKTTPTPTSSGRSWAARSSWRSPMASSISGPGNRSSTASLTAADQTGIGEDHWGVAWRFSLWVVPDRMNGMPLLVISGECHAHHRLGVHQRRRGGVARGLRRWLEKLAPFDPSPEPTITTAPAKTTPTPT